VSKRRQNAPNMTPQKEAKLINELLGENPEKGYASIFDNYYSAMCAFAMKYVDNSFEAEQCAMDVFLKIWEKRKELEIKTDLKYYLFASVRNRALDLIRKNSRKSSLDSEAFKHIPAADPDPEERLYWKNAVFRVEAAIDDLPKRCKRIFLMSRHDGKKYHEIASELNLSVKTVETQISRALKSLREVRASA